MKSLFIKVLSFVLLLVCGVALLPQQSFSLSTKAENDVVTREVSSPQQFIDVFSSSIYNNSNIEVVIKNDIDFDGVNLSSVYEGDNVFCGTLNGGGYTISNLLLTSGTNNYGLIPHTKGATIKNLRVTGDVAFQFDQENTNDIYVGILVGYGENTKIENCELYNITVESVQDTETGETTQVENKNNVAVDVYSDLYFGGLVGKLKGNPNIYEPNIKDTVSFYGVDVDMKKYSNLYIGGLVGYFEQGYVLNCLSFGDITINNTLDAIANKKQHLGGIAGYIIGTNSKIFNACYGGTIKQTSLSSNLNIQKGAVAGTVSEVGAPSVYNVNYAYWTKDLNAVGEGFLSTSAYLAKVDVIDKTLLADETKFDPSNEKWNFDTVWKNLRLQIFQNYDLTFNPTLDITQILKTATFTVDGVETQANSVNVKYGKTIYITLTLKQDYYGYYSLSSILLNGSTLIYSQKFSDCAITNSAGFVTGYRLPIVVTDMTDGTYSFTLVANTFHCVVKISDDAKTLGQGGVKRDKASSTTQEMTLSFTYSMPTNRVVAVGSGIYTFDYWELYQYGEGDELVRVDFPLSSQSSLSINFGKEEYFKKEFVLIAYFTDENAVKVAFNTIDTTKIKSVVLNGSIYGEDEEIVLPPKSTTPIPLEVITNDRYLMNYERFLNEFQTLYGEGSITLTNDPIKNDETGETTYKFNITMNQKLLDNVENNTIQFNITAREDESGKGIDMVYVYIAAGVIVLIIVAVVVVVIIKKRRGGGKGPGKKNTKAANTTSTNNSSYSDYYV